MSNEIQGWYYLHVNGSLIYKPDPEAITDIRDSDLARGTWAWMNSRDCAWGILVEALSAGAKKERIMELAEKWGCNDKDALLYAKYINLDIDMDGNQCYARRKDFTNIQESPIGFGNTYLEAMADLCDALGYKCSKMWGNNFKNLVTDEATQ